MQFFLNLSIRSETMMKELRDPAPVGYKQIHTMQEMQEKKKFLLILPCGYDQGALSSGHELADGTLCELAADF